MWLSPPRLSRTAPLNLVFDGNSLVASPANGGIGAAAGQTMPAQALALLRRRFADVVSTNIGIGGQSWRAMDGYSGENGNGSSDADAAWSMTRTNVLIAWETTNAIGFGRTPAQAAADARSYIANRLAAHPGWHIVALSTIPRQQMAGSPTQGDIDAYNAGLVQADALIAAGLRAWGGAMFVDLRCPGSPFRYADYAASTFARDDALWNEAAGSRVHLTGAGYAIVAGLVARAVLNLAAR